MISKNNKLIKYSSIAVLAVAVLAASLSSTNINISKNILRGRASETVYGTINFVNTGDNVTLKSNAYYFLSSSTQTGQTVYLRNYCSGDYSDGCVASMSSGSEITFSSDNSTANPVHFGFQKITSIYARSTASNSRQLEISTSSDGVTYSGSSDFFVSSAGQTYNFGSGGAQYIKITYSSFLPVILDQFSISYTCSSTEPEPVKVLDSIEVKTAPATTSYTEGDNFDPTGLVITATYDDESSEDVEYEGNEESFTFSPSLSTELSTEDTSVTITYGGKSCSQSITVEEGEEPEYFLTGTYVLNYDSTLKWKLTFNANGTGDYKKYSSSNSLLGTDTFSYSFDGTNLVFTNVTCTFNNWGNYYLTYGTTATSRNSSNSGTVSGNVISITTYSTNGSTTRAATYTKA